MVKRFMQARSGTAANANRYAPEAARDAAAFTQKSRKPIGPDADELATNPRARSARLRIAIRTDAPAGAIATDDLDMPMLKGGR